MVIVSIIMRTTKQNINMKMNWNALDSCWAEQYEVDYGNLFNTSNLNNHKISISASNIEADMLVCA